MTIHFDNKRVNCCQEKSTFPDYHSVICGERLPLRAKPSNLAYGAHGPASRVLRGTGRPTEGWRCPASPRTSLLVMTSQTSETVAKWLCVTRSWHDASCPGNELPVYCQVSLLDSRYLSPFGATDSSLVLYRRATIVARFPP